MQLRSLAPSTNPDTRPTAVDPKVERMRAQLYKWSVKLDAVETALSEADEVHHEARHRLTALRAKGNRLREKLERLAPEGQGSFDRVSHDVGRAWRKLTEGLRNVRAQHGVRAHGAR